MSTAVTHNDLANAIRALAMDAVEQAKSGHPGMPMGMADVATVLFREVLRFDPAQPEWPDRDRFVLSAGHGSMLLYAVLYLLGVRDMTLDQIKAFRTLGSITAGHPEFGHAPGVETTTGPLGQGLATAVGMAIAERSLNKSFGDDLVDHHTYVIAGDGCLMEGVSQEAISLAGHLRLSRLIVLWDDNQISIDGPVALSSSEDQVKRFEAAGWATRALDGHDPDAIRAGLAWAKTADKPVLLACRTVIGKGAPKKAGTASSHGSPLGAEEIAGARAALGWPHGPFEIPAPILDAWRASATRGADLSAAWAARHAKHDTAEFDRRLSGQLPDLFGAVIRTAKRQFSEQAPKIATRQSSGMVLDELVPLVPELLGGSADLTGSNNTKAKGVTLLTADRPDGRYLHYGIREHGMAAAMNGIALHGGLIPFGGTFLVFTDYCRPAIRLSALMGQRVVYVMTHDSIGLGEDGPTHQPVEHLASLRAIPGLTVFRPGDAVEVAECWALALTLGGPSVLALTRQALPTLRTLHTDENVSARGGYVLLDPAQRDITLLATGSELHIAVDAARTLAAEGIQAAVVSLPSWELFGQQDRAYREAVLGAVPRLAIEAASPFGWTRFVGTESDVIGMTGFGASAPAEDLYRHFGITSAALAAKARATLGR